MPGPGNPAGGACNKAAMRRNREAFAAAAVCPRVMSGTESPDVSPPVSGIPPSMSVIMSRPAHDPKYAGAKKENAAGVAAAKTVMSVGTYTNGTIPDIAVVGQGAPQLVQLCVRKDDAFNRRICDEAEKTAPKRPALPLMPPLTAM